MADAKAAAPAPTTAKAIDLDAALGNLLTEEPKQVEQAPQPEVEETPEPVAEETETVPSQPEDNAVEASSQETPAEGQPEEEKAEPPEWYVKEVQKLRKRAQEAEARLKTFEQDEAPAQPEPVPQAAAPLNHPVLQKLAGDEAKAKANAQTAKDLLRKIRHDPDNVVNTLVQNKMIPPGTDADAAQEWLEQQSDVWSEKLIDVRGDIKMAQVQVQAQLQTAMQQNAAQAMTDHPWMSKPEDERFKLAQETIKKFPGLAQHPEGFTLLGRYIEGEYLHRQKGKTAAPAVQKQQPPKSPGSSVARPSQPQKGDGASAAYRRAMKTMNDEDIVNAMPI